MSARPSSAATCEAIVERVNSLQADMVAVTGDLVDGTVQRPGRTTRRRCRGLASRHGTFFVTGNHEYYCGADAWVAELRRLGLRVLMNEHVRAAAWRGLAGRWPA